MRSLANLGLVTEDGTHRFALTPLGEALKTGAPGAARATILTIASDLWMRGFGQLPYSLETGKSGFEKLLGMPFFDWLATHPEDASLFSETMVGFHGGGTRQQSRRLTTSPASTLSWMLAGRRGIFSTTILALSGPRGYAVRSPSCRARCAGADPRRAGSRARIRSWRADFFASSPGWRRRLSALAHHPRLGRTSSASPSWPLP